MAAPCSGRAGDASLFLEKQLIDLRTFIDTLPILDAAEDWDYKPEVDSFVSKPIAHEPHQESAEEPRQVRGDQGTSGPGRDVHGRCLGRHLDDDEIQRRHPRRDAQRHAGARPQAARRRQVSTRGGERLEVKLQKIGAVLGYIFEGK